MGLTGNLPRASVVLFFGWFRLEDAKPAELTLLNAQQDSTGKNDKAFKLGDLEKGSQ